MMKIGPVPSWQEELWSKGLDIIERVLVPKDSKFDDMAASAIASALASMVDQAYSIGVCIGAASKETQVDRRCHRNQN